MTDARRGISLLALAAACLATSAFAQGVPADQAATNDDILVTAQQLNETQIGHNASLGALGDKDAADVPFSIRSYNSTLILNQQPQTLGELLQNDPTIRTTYGFGNAAELFVIRGFPLFGDDVGFDGLYGITPRQLVAPELYEQVQVLNGASAFLNGAAPGGTGIGGSVNLVPKRAGSKDLLRATANYTSGSHFGGSFDASHRFGDVGVRLNGAYRAGDVSVDGEFRKAVVIGGALDWSSGPVRFTADLAYQRYEVRRLRPKVTVATTTIPAVPAADHNYGQPFSYTVLRDIFGSAKLEYDVAPNATLYLQGGARDGLERGIYNSITVTNALTGAATGTALYVPRTDNNEAVTGGARVKLAAGGIAHEFNVGMSASWQTNRNAYDFRYGPGFAGYQTNIYVTPTVAEPASTLVGGNLANPGPRTRTWLVSAFASDTIGLFEDRVLITGGLRLQQIVNRSYDYTTGAVDKASYYAKDAVTPVVGVVVKPVAGLSLFANRIEALSPGATAPATALLPGGTAPVPVSNMGVSLDPYKSVQYEVGGKLGLRRFNASLAAFQTALPVGQVSADPRNAGRAIFGAFGEQRNRGIELTVDGELAHGLRLIAGGSVLDAKLRKTLGGVNQGNYAPGVPRYTANANVEWDLPFVPGFTLTGRVVQTGKQSVNNANTLTIPEWTRFDAGARFVAVLADRPVTFRFNVDNLANKRYWASAFDSFNQALLQGLPRTYKGSVSIDF